MKKQISQYLNKKPILALAPMAGYTDSAFRVICLEGGADLVYTEMISAEGLARNNKKTLAMLNFLPDEKNVIVQLFGKNPEAFADATKIINTLFYHSERLVEESKKEIPPLKATKIAVQNDNKVLGVDINLGCPAHKVFKTGAGAALMDNKKLAREIIMAVLENTNLPVSIKIRSQVKNTTAEDFINYIKDLPIKLIMVHGRSLAQGMTGSINFAMIKRVKELLPDKIVLGNGGIDSEKKFKEMLEKTGVDGVGIGRGALGQPWIFSQCQIVIPLKNKIQKTFKECHNQRLSASLLTAPSSDSASLIGERPRLKKAGISFILRHAKLFLQQNSNLIALRKHLVHYFKGQKNASGWRQKLIKIKTLEDLISALVGV